MTTFKSCAKRVSILFFFKEKNTGFTLHRVGKRSVAGECLTSNKSKRSDDFHD